MWLGYNSVGWIHLREERASELKRFVIF